jgi:hypothetical protein
MRVLLDLSVQYFEHAAVNVSFTAVQRQSLSHNNGRAKAVTDAFIRAVICRDQGRHGQWKGSDTEWR